MMRVYRSSRVKTAGRSGSIASMISAVDYTIGGYSVDSISCGCCGM